MRARFLWPGLARINWLDSSQRIGNLQTKRSRQTSDWGIQSKQRWLVAPARNLRLEILCSLSLPFSQLLRLGLSLNTFVCRSQSSVSSSRAAWYPFTAGLWSPKRALLVFAPGLCTWNSSPGTFCESDRECASKTLRVDLFAWQCISQKRGQTFA